MRDYKIVDNSEWASVIYELKCKDCCFSCCRRGEESFKTMSCGILQKKFLKNLDYSPGPCSLPSRNQHYEL